MKIFQEKFCDDVFKLCLLGATDKQISNFLGIAESTFNSWKKKYPVLVESIKKGKDRADAEIAHALYHRAKGYSHPEDKFFQFEGKIITVSTIKHYPPDTAAAFIWLKNRKCKEWKNNPGKEESQDELINEELNIPVDNNRDLSQYLNN